LRSSRLTPQQARDLIAWAGSQRRAASAVGVPRSTLWTWLYPERNREQSRRWAAENFTHVHQKRLQRYYDLRDAGLCITCKKPRLSESRCWNCLNQKEQARTEETHAVAVGPR
jgi:hypothetical protein